MLVTCTLHVNQCLIMYAVCTQCIVLALHEINSTLPRIVPAFELYLRPGALSQEVFKEYSSLGFDLLTPAPGCPTYLALHAQLHIHYQNW